MNIKKDRASDLWNLIGSFGILEAGVKEDGNKLVSKNDSIEVISETTEHENGVFVRQTKVKNISDGEVSLNTLSSKFILEGREYEVYTQGNFWQHESEGGWQKLITSVSARSKSLRNACGAAPFMVIWSLQQNRGTAFHLSAYSAWEMRASFTGDVKYTELEMGVLSEGLNLTLKPGEEIDLPEIIYYDVVNKTDMDAWKLHGYLNREYPRRELPVIYNTWLYKFDRFTPEDILLQIKKAKELGIEYFVIDAGWFGDGADWWPQRGDWKENLTFGFKGRMKEISDEVRKSGMKFGFWLEAESASMGAEIVKKHPEYFIGGNGSYFIDFANEEAAEYIYNTTCELIDRYGAEFIKFDFNADLSFDCYRTGFINYFKGHCNYIKRLKEKYPSLYIENCASGGMRMSIRDGLVYDSYWPTDNQSPYHSLRIFKDSILRMPPQWIEGWLSLRSAEKFSHTYGVSGKVDKLFSTDDALWSNVVSVDKSFLKGFMKGRSIALSSDLASLSEEAFAEFKEHIEEFKKERSFWLEAVCHILTDTPSMLSLEFRNSDFSKVEIVVFSKMPKQESITVYPIVDADSCYEKDGDMIIEGKSLEREGIVIPVTAANGAWVVKLKWKND